MRRIIVKLSGELLGESKIEFEKALEIAKTLIECKKMGYEIGVVIGGIVFLKLIKYLLDNYHLQTFYSILSQNGFIMERIHTSPKWEHYRNGQVYILYSTGVSFHGDFIWY